MSQGGVTNRKKSKPVNSNQCWNFIISKEQKGGQPSLHQVWGSMETYGIERGAAEVDRKLDTSLIVSILTFTLLTANAHLPLSPTPGSSVENSEPRGST